MPAGSRIEEIRDDAVFSPIRKDMQALVAGSLAYGRMAGFGS